jgi:hypothetical protein
LPVRAAQSAGNWFRVGARITGASIRPVEVNGSPGALLLDGEDRLISVLALDIAEGQIRAVSSVVNPEKLGHLGQVADVKALLRSRARGR